jgi:hypothetical protein
VIADCLANWFTSHDLCEKTHERQVQGRVEALLVSADVTPFEKKIRPCDIS